MPNSHQEIRDHIARSISVGELAPGAKLESEVKLAERFGVTRSIVRLALDLLEADGYVDRSHGKGTFVSTRPPERSPAAVRSISFVAPNLAEPFVGKMLAGAEETAAAAGWTLTVTATGDSIDRESVVLEGLINAGSSGVLIHPTNADFYNPTLVRTVAEGVPTVMIGRHYEFLDCSFVEPDNRFGVREAVRFLVEAGHSHIGAITKPCGLKSSMANRVRGYLEGLSEAGIPFRRDLMFDSLMDPRSVYAGSGDEGIRASVVSQIRGFLSQNRALTAVIAFNDLIAYDTAIAARSIGMSPRNDIAIVGCDDVEAGLPRDHLSATVHIPIRAVGSEGARALLSIVDAPDTSIHRLLGVELCVLDPPSRCPHHAESPF